MLVELSKIKKPKDEKYTATVLDFNSPRTIEAMLMLELTIRNKDYFREPGVDDDIVLLRFSNYVQRYNKTVKSILAQRRHAGHGVYTLVRPKTSSMPRLKNGSAKIDVQNTINSLSPSKNKSPTPGSKNQQSPEDKSVPSKQVERNYSAVIRTKNFRNMSDPQYCKIMENLEKDIRCNTQKVREYLELENVRKSAIK